MTKPIRAKKSLGQNFLVDPHFQRRIVEALNPEPGDSILEIGAGTGALTQHLVGRVANLTAVELDDVLASTLRRQYAQHAEFTLIHGDVMKVDLRPFAGAKAVGNIPYNITSPLIFRLLGREVRPVMLVLMLQKEVADRATSLPGKSTYGALTVGIQSVADIERLFVVPQGAFRPAPKVDSAVVRIVPHRPAKLSEHEEFDLRLLSRAAFAWRRKQLQNILRHAAGFRLKPEHMQQIADATGVNMTDRPERLSPAQFIELSRALRTLGYPTEAHTS